MKLNVATARPTRSWLDRFADRLQVLKPGATGVDANRQALAAAALIQYVSSEPEDAAAAYCVHALSPPRAEPPQWRNEG